MSDMRLPSHRLKTGGHYAAYGKGTCVRHHVGVYACRVTIFPCDYERLGCDTSGFGDVPSYALFLIDEFGASEEKWYIDHDEWREYVYFTEYHDALKFLLMWAS